MVNENFQQYRTPNMLIPIDIDKFKGSVSDDALQHLSETMFKYGSKFGSESSGFVAATNMTIDQCKTQNK